MEPNPVAKTLNPHVTPAVTENYGSQILLESNQGPCELVMVSASFLPAVELRTSTCIWTHYFTPLPHRTTATCHFTRNFS